MAEKPPFLNSGLAAIAAALGAAVPLATWIHGCNQLRLEEAKQQHAVRMDYLDRAIDPELDDRKREAVLNFLVSTVSRTNPMHAWAEGELALTKRFIAQQIAQKEKVRALESLIAEMSADQTRMNRELDVSKEEAKALEAARRELAGIRRELRRAQRQEPPPPVAAGPAEDEAQQYERMLEQFERMQPPGKEFTCQAFWLRVFRYKRSDSACRRRAAREYWAAYQQSLTFDYALEGVRCSCIRESGGDQLNP